MKGFKFSDAELEDIRTAVARAEEKTSGEITAAVIKESSSYAFPELLVSLTAGLVCFVIMLFCHGGIERFISRLFWEPRGWYVTAFYGLAAFLVIIASYWLTNIPGADRLIVPRAAMKKAVHRRAMVHFLESGVYDTRDRTGILIFISLREKQMEIVADSGINSKVEQEVWDKLLADLAEGIHSGNTAAGLVTLIESCGEILAAHFPIKPDDRNELPDALVFLEE